jgi:hypothetical protein
MSDTVLEMIKKEKIDYGMIKGMHDNIEKFVNYAIRILNKKGADEKSQALYYIITELEEISDKYTFLMKQLNMEKELVIDKSAVELLAHVNKSLQKFHDFFYDCKMDNAMEIIKDRRYVSDESCRLIRKAGIKNNIMFGQLFAIETRILNLLEARIGME